MLVVCEETTTTKKKTIVNLYYWLASHYCIYIETTNLLSYNLDWHWVLYLYSTIDSVLYLTHVLFVLHQHQQQQQAAGTTECWRYEY